MIQELIVGAIKAGLTVFKMTREALAAELEEIAAKVRAGALIPEEAFEKAKATRDATQDAYDKLPE